MNRRQFIVGCGTGAALLTSSQLQSFSFIPVDGTSDDQSPIFVLIFLRGGCDGLSLAAPVNDKNYIDSRSTYLRINESGDNAGLSLQNPLAGLDFRLHSKASALKEIYDSNQMAIIHACGLSNGTRSHFDAQDMIERGVNQKVNANEGWLARYLSTLKTDSPLPAIASNSFLPASFLGSNKASSINEINEFNLPGDSVRFLSLLKNLYNGKSLLDTTAQKTIESIKYVQSKVQKDNNGKPIDYQPEHGADYPDDWYISQLSKSLANVAQLIKMEVGTQIATVDFGGWDTHENQNYYFPLLLDGLSRALGAFYNDLSSYHSRLTVLVMSEFGRRLKGNKSMGTDHGYGNAMLALGGNVKGGKMYGNWPGLETDQLDNGVDLAVTTDYRSILGEILVKVLKNNQLDFIFPGFKEYKPLGFL